MLRLQRVSFYVAAPHLRVLLMRAASSQHSWPRMKAFQSIESLPHFDLNRPADRLARYFLNKEFSETPEEYKNRINDYTYENELLAAIEDELSMLQRKLSKEEFTNTFGTESRSESRTRDFVDYFKVTNDEPLGEMISNKRGMHQDEYRYNEPKAALDTTAPDGAQQRAATGKLDMNFKAADQYQDIDSKNSSSTESEQVQEQHRRDIQDTEEYTDNARQRYVEPRDKGLRYLSTKRELRYKDWEDDKPIPRYKAFKTIEVPASTSNKKEKLSEKADLQKSENYDKKISLSDSPNVSLSNLSEVQVELMDSDLRKLMRTALLNAVHRLDSGEINFKAKITIANPTDEEKEKRLG